MKPQASTPQKRCCIVIAHEGRAERSSQNPGSYTSGFRRSAAVNGGFLRQASLRARRLASPANVLVSAQDVDRSSWEGPLWFTRPSNRFICYHGTPTSLSTAAAMLSVAARYPSCLMAVLPCDFWVARESVLLEAIERVFGLLQLIPESVATLGMIDTHTENDEDYLVVGPNNVQKGAVIQARVNRPEPRIAKRLMGEGAMVASGILLGYAEAFAARLSKYWPQLARELISMLGTDCHADIEHRLSTDEYRQIPRSVMNSIRLSPPTFPMRAFRVQGSGWCSRKPLSDVPSEPAATWRTNTLGGNAGKTRDI